MPPGSDSSAGASPKESALKESALKGSAPNGSAQASADALRAVGASVLPKESDVGAMRLRVYPDSVLRERCKPVAISDALPAVAHRMLEIMRAEEGIGLAAPQVGLAWRMFVLDVPRPKDDKKARDAMSIVEGAPAWSDGPMVFVNPVIDASEGSVEASEEGCLSLPEVRCKVLRPPVVVIAAVDAKGTPFRVRASGLLARCMQHEFDHIEGVLLLDRMSPMDRLKNRRAIKELERG
jgi:peptide deformylase